MAGSRTGDAIDSQLSSLSTAAAADREARGAPKKRRAVWVNTSERWARGRGQREAASGYGMVASTVDVDADAGVDAAGVREKSRPLEGTRT